MAGIRTLRERVYVGRANAIVLQFLDKDPNTGVETAKDLSAYDRMVLTILDDTPVQIDSDVETGAFDWTTLNTPTNTGKVQISIGEVSGIPTSGILSVRLTAFEGSSATELVHEDMPEQDVLFEFVSVSSIA